MTEITELIGRVSILEGKKEESVEAELKYEETLDELEEILDDNYCEFRAEEIMRYVDTGQYDEAYTVVEEEWRTEL